jgi:hypothetical protein
MNDQLTEARVVQPPASVASTATTTMTFDTIGFDYAVVDVLLGTHTTTDPTLTVLKFTESDDTVLTNFAAITPLTGGTVGNTSGFFVIPAATVNGLGGAIQFQIDLRKRKRYLKMNCTPGTTQVLGAVVSLGRPEQAKLTAAQKSVVNDPGSSAAVACMTVVAV